MSDRRSVFPLRFRRGSLRELVRQIAERENISQNELIEQAIEHEVLLRGELMARDLDLAPEALRRATDDELERLVAASIDDFARGEGQPDPVAAHRIRRGPGDADDRQNRLDAVAAFRGRRS
jgi:hypothetical protein